MRRRTIGTTQLGLGGAVLWLLFACGSSGGDGSTSAGGDGGGAGAGSPGRGGSTAVAGSPGDALSDRHPDDEGLDDEPTVLFHDDFEGGWGKWSSPTQDTQTLHLEEDPEMAHAGAGYLRSTVTADDLEAETYISSSTRADLPERVNQLYLRYHVRFVGLAPNPHHWVRVAAGTEDFSSSGLANTVPPGDQGYWFDFDANADDAFNFYVYWYKMRSGRCNDGTAVPGCAGDQGSTYHYGNIFRPPEQEAFPRDEWFCVELMAKGNTVGDSDGELAFFINNRLVGEYQPGTPEGTWLRDSFHTGGCSFSACTPPEPFEGFDFRSDSDVLLKQVFLDAYYELGSFTNKKAELEERGLTVLDVQTILYDDVVVATERIGCQVTR